MLSSQIMSQPEKTDLYQLFVISICTSNKTPMLHTDKLGRKSMIFDAGCSLTILISVSIGSLI